MPISSPAPGNRVEREPMQQKKVLLVDDETAFLLSARKVLQGPDLAVDTADNLDDAIKMIDAHHYDIVVTDIRLTDVASREGMDILRHVMVNHPGTKVILLTGYGTPEIMERAYAMGASNYLEKPLSGTVLKSILQNARQG
jgi:DNA-binding NtrC family response regulator